MAASLLVLGAVPSLLPVDAAEPGLEKVGEFRPFGTNRMGSGFEFSSTVDADRRTWFFVAPVDPATGMGGNSRVWQFDLDRRAQVGGVLHLSGHPGSPVTAALDRRTGNLWHVYGDDGAKKIGVIQPTRSGPKLLVEWAVGSALARNGGAYSLTPVGLEVVGDKAFLAATAPSHVVGGDSVLLQLDVAKLVAGQSPVDWTYPLTRCATLPYHFLPTAIGVNQARATIAVGCRAPFVGSDIQGVNVIETGTFGAGSTRDFVEHFYPIAGDYGTAEAYYDPVTDRIAMRRTGPAQLVTFDIAHRRWMRPVLFGQNNLWQSDLDHTTGRIYGQGNDPGGSGAFLYVPEVRPTPPQNGLVQPFSAATGDPQGRLAIDSAKHEVYIADLDVVRDRATNTETPRGMFFHVYRDHRPPLDTTRQLDPDKEIINLSGEAQGYGGRVSYVGGIGGTYSNAMQGSEYQFGSTAAQGTRQITFARTSRMRLTEGDASAEATVSHPDGAAGAEAGNAPGGWPHDPVGCRDFGNAPATAQDPSGQAEVECDVEYPKVASRALYEAKTSDPYSAPVQRALTNASTTISKTKGVITIVTSEGSLDLPGLVSIGRVRATAITYSAGKKGTARSEYIREMKDVRIAGQQHCAADCDPDEVARAINEQFAPLAANGVLVHAEAPDPDPDLLASPGGVQAILQRDSFAHEEDVGVHDGADDRYELPAFTVAVYQDRRYPQHEIYSLAGVQAVSRLPQSLADDLDDLGGPDDDPAASLSPDIAGGSPESLADFDAPTRPPGSSLSAPLAPRRGRNGSIGLAERMAWTVASPLRSPAMLAIFAFFAVPVYLSSRRWLLLSYRPAQAGDVDAT